MATPFPQLGLGRGGWFLLRELVAREVRGRYAGSLLGLAWSLVQPLWHLVLFGFVFSTVMKVSPAGEGTGSFATFLFSGLLPWLALQEGVMRSATAITDQANLVRKMAFPPAILVMAAVIAALLHEALALAVFVVILFLTGHPPGAGLAWLMVAVPLQFFLTLGLGLLVASSQVFARDTAQVLGLVMSGWFYLTPIVYPLSYVPDRFRPWIEANPLTALVGLYRRALLGSGVVEIRTVATLGAVALAAWLAGAWLFGRLQQLFVDEV